MKMPVEWHQKCLRNSKRYHLKEKDRIETELFWIKQQIKADKIYELQIDSAIREGKESFDQATYKNADLNSLRKTYYLNQR